MITKEKIEGRLNRFGLENQEIWQIYRGINPDGGTECYFLIVNPKEITNEGLENKITDLDIELAREGASIDIIEWPMTRNLSGNYPFIQELIVTYYERLPFEYKISTI